MTFEELDRARRLFGLGDRATLKEIKARHRDLVRRHHPDSQARSDDPMIRQVNAAYAVLTAYCRDYAFSFAREEFFEQEPEERLRYQFSQDPVWSGGGEG
jgi:DnaJ-class molecular chaperone